MKKRIYGQKLDLDYRETRAFFADRAARLRQDNPYAVTMYQDEHPEIVRQRHRRETEKLLPLLQLAPGSRVLDVACGIGRWAEAIRTPIASYCGVDFSPELVEIARSRNKAQQHCRFLVGDAQELETVLQGETFDRILCIGILMYLNDRDVQGLLEQLSCVAAPRALVLLREPLGEEKRLMLKGFYSEELQHDYHAIYRTREEMRELLQHLQGFRLVEHDRLFAEAQLNNRRETAQYYYLLARGRE